MDTSEISFIRKNIEQGDICVDLGCHKGAYLYWLVKGVGKKGKVYAFEPQVILYDYLLSIKRVFGYEHVVLENMGVSSQEGSMQFFIPLTKSGTSPGAKILDSKKENENGNLVKIEVTTLDKYFFERKIFPQLLKIDVEGHEKFVLLGGINLLKACKPVILLECENRHQETGNIQEVFQLLLDLGYEGYFFQEKRLRSINEFNPSIHQKTGEARYWQEKGYINNFVFLST